MNCDQTENLSRYFDDELPGSQRAAVEAHLQNCADCQTLLSELQSVSRLLDEAPLPPVSRAAMNKYYGAWNKAARSGVLRIASWMSGVAAAALVGGLLWPAARPVPAPLPADKAVAWDAVALMPSMTPEAGGERGDELVQMAQWMADDLSDGR